MFIRRMIFCNIIFTFISIISYSQLKYSSVYFGENLKLEIQINKIVFKKKDTLKINLLYLNLSNDTLAVLRDNEFSKFGNEYLNFIRFDNGGSFEPGIERNIELIKLFPNDSLLLTFEYDYEYFVTKSINSFWGLFISLGYISNINKLYHNEKLSKHEIQEISPKDLKISSLIVFPSITIVDFTAFIFRYVNKE